MNELQTIDRQSLKPGSGQKYAVMFTNELTPATNASYSSDIKNFFKVKEFSDITVAMIQSVNTDMANKWIQSLIKIGRKPSTINKKAASLFSFYKFLCRRSVGIMTYNPFSTDEGCIRLKNATSSYTAKGSLTDQEAEKLLNIVPVPKYGDDRLHQLQYRRDYIIIAFLFVTGCRRDELVKIKLGDFFETGLEHLVRITGKGGKERILIIPDSLYEKILDYVDWRKLSMKDSGEYLITRHEYKGGKNAEIRRGLKLSDPSVNMIIKKYVEKAGLDPERVTPHALRHTFCTESLRAGAKLEDVQDLMGHSNINTTRRYDHINRTIEHSTSEILAEKYKI